MLAVACKDKDAEKKIAALEARLSELEDRKPASVSVTPTDNPVPSQPQQKPEGPLPAIQFEKLDHDFGTIQEGKKVTYTYKFKNTGEAPLIIQGVQPTCGCTAPDWSKEPIPPGGEGFVKAEFDSSGKPNMQNKSVTVTANTWPESTVLSFKAMVIPKGDSQGPAK
ncbi:MAG: DUF1573 domain-containing protein [Cyclobacteriaceae bacterium]|nr:DUF1573 domain-containing protein [Cyclobacteriaceae bacterium]